jgi:hypothetical protein
MRFTVTLAITRAYFNQEIARPQRAELAEAKMDFQKSAELAQM